jgi:hypothetical protein
MLVIFGGKLSFVIRTHRKLVHIRRFALFPREARQNSAWPSTDVFLAPLKLRDQLIEVTCNSPI